MQPVAYFFVSFSSKSMIRLVSASFRSSLASIESRREPRAGGESFGDRAVLNGILGGASTVEDAIANLAVDIFSLSVMEG